MLPCPEIASFRPLACAALLAFAWPAAFAADGEPEFERRGEIPVADLSGIGNARRRTVTAMDFAPDGRRLALLTYDVALELVFDAANPLPAAGDWSAGRTHRGTPPKAGGIGLRARAVDQPHQHRERDEQHRPQVERRHGEDRDAAGGEGHGKPPPAVELLHPSGECAGSMAGASGVRGNGRPNAARKGHRPPHAFSEATGAAAPGARGW